MMRPPLIPAAALAVLMAATPTAAQQPQAVTVELSSFKFTPATLTLTHGHSYLIHFTNNSSGSHNFVAKEFFAAAIVALGDRAKISNGGISLSGGESADIHLIPNVPGTYKSHCSHFMHSSLGMTGKVVVE